ncbi:SGNH/GDSL hydrolase family protein [Hespellia stercorisuis]|uniref:Lysophospholipase L1 n=1 Tax=Hespellia stercorisuis DSM 15480 TaxID=1121950 RepID=A0A1M6PAY0_9FIRM|nr:SGNH/GDSL hydrolase family protein [Hespellia stercorisuis]SHK05088.1 Lysophospholipase L1 [Hespellia stercorisuis DSM 15480]
MTNVLCFGDSNTYGYIPDGSGRFSRSVRWTGLLQEMLGREYHIIEEGLCGRTTVFQDEIRFGRRGLDHIGVAVESHNPVDVLVIMLGTNDCKSRYAASAKLIARGVEEVAARAKCYASENMQILIVSPIQLKPGVGAEGFDMEFDVRSEEVSRKLAAEYARVAEKNGYAFLDAARVTEASEADREHLDAYGHRELAEAIARKLCS